MSRGSCRKSREKKGLAGTKARRFVGRQETLTKEFHRTRSGDRARGQGIGWVVKRKAQTLTEKGSRRPEH